MTDRYGRNIDYLRISVTDRCNMHCIYCMPEEKARCLSKSKILTFDEIMQVVRVGAELGIENIRITGGEPLLRKDIDGLIYRIKMTEGIKSVTLTTNGLLFRQMGERLLSAGLDGVNFSLDSRSGSAFKSITRVDACEKVQEAVLYAARAGLPTKINCVPLHPCNPGDITALAEFSMQYPVSVRFIELMPIGTGLKYSAVKTSDILRHLTKVYGQPTPSDKVCGNGPAVYYDFPGFKSSVGFISAMTQQFCASCNRVRLTASGLLKPCLCYNEGLELGSLLKNGIPDGQLKETMQAAIFGKPSRHRFNMPACSSCETRSMAQIGG